MYVNPAFKTDEEAAWTFVAERGFGCVVAVEDGRPVGAHVPLLVVGEGGGRRIEFHVARANPLAAIVAAAPRVTIMVTGPDAYISPDWYVATDQVPTWNYMAAHISGTATPLAAERYGAHVEAVSQAFERRLAPKRPWSTTKMTEQRLAMMLKAIIAIEVAVDGIEASFKLSQNKTRTDALEVARMLDWRGGAGERGIAEAMRRRLKSS